MPRLIQLNGAGATRQLSLRTPMTMIGRAETNDIVLDNVRASRFHAALVTNGTAVTIEDMSSRNGLFLNGVRISSAQLANGDTIVLGGAMFRFLAEVQPLAMEPPLYLQPLSQPRSPTLSEPLSHSFLQSRSPPRPHVGSNARAG